jgi:hypothetical protein
MEGFAYTNDPYREPKESSLIKYPAILDPEKLVPRIVDFWTSSLDLSNSTREDAAPTLPEFLTSCKASAANYRDLGDTL